MDRVFCCNREPGIRFLHRQWARVITLSPLILSLVALAHHRVTYSKDLRTSGKMTLIFDPQTYAKLLTRYQPKVIETEKDNERAIAIAQELAHRQNRTVEESALFKLKFPFDKSLHCMHINA